MCTPVKHTRQRDWSKIPAENVTGQNLKFMHLTATVAVEKEAEKEEEGEDEKGRVTRRKARREDSIADLGSIVSKVVCTVF